jgi:hypothetical protein
VTGYCQAVIIFWVILEQINHYSNYYKITSALEATIAKLPEVAEGRNRVAAHRMDLYSMKLLSFLLLFSYDVVL